MNCINYKNSYNTVSFCECRLNPVSVTKIIRKNSLGLSNSESCENNLSEGKYIPVLSAIWGEKDKEKRLAWLRSHASELHAPLMYEQALAEFVNDPTAETVSNISLPLIRAASFRVQQDAQCSQDASVYHGDAALRMETNYVRSLKQAIKKYAPSLELESIQNERREEMRIEIKKKLKEIIEQTLSAPDRLPDPTWIGYHGISCAFGQPPSMHSISLFGQKRQEMAQTALSQVV